MKASTFVWNSLFWSRQHLFFCIHVFYKLHSLVCVFGVVSWGTLFTFIPYVILMNELLQSWYDLTRPRSRDPGSLPNISLLTHCPVYCIASLVFLYDSFQLPCSVFLSDFLAAAESSPTLEFEQLPFNHPLYIMFSSGTTGAPKCMVHSAGVGNLDYSNTFLG